MSVFANGLPSNLQAILFDFDGTLADSYQAITASVNHVRQHYQLEPLSEPVVRGFVGHGPKHLLSHTVGMGDSDKNVKMYRKHHPSVMCDHTFLLPGTMETLKTLRNLGLKSAICSNKPRIYTMEIIKYLGIETWFDVVVGPEDVPRRKPAPDMLLKGIERLGVAKDQALYVGDMVIDIETARSAEVMVWIVPTGSHTKEILEQAKPDRLLESMADLPAILKKS